MGEHMFFVPFVPGEPRRRMRQTIFIALGLALGVGLVVTVTAASAGVKKAQADVLSSLYGVGTDMTVTGAAPGPPKSGTPPKNAQTFQVGPGGAQMCSNGKCHNAAGQTVDNLGSQYQALNASELAAVAKLHGVAAAAGGLTLTDNQLTLPKNFGQPGGSLPQPKGFNVDGVDIGHSSLGPLSAGTIKSGHSLTAAEANSDVAVGASRYAKANSLKVASTITIAKTKFTVVGIVAQPQRGSPPARYIPLAPRQPIRSTAGESLKNKVNAIYGAAASAADIPAVQNEISKL